MYFSIGYPLGFVKKDDNPSEECLIELQNGYVGVGSAEALLWYKAKNLLDTPENIVPSLKGLIKLNVLIKYENNEELYEQIKDLKVIRQGHPIFLGSNRTYTIDTGLLGTSLTDVQFELWKCCKFNSTIEEIYHIFKDYMSVDQFINEILFFKSEFIIYVI